MKAFLDAGYQVEAIDGSAELARYASDVRVGREEDKWLNLILVK